MKNYPFGIILFVMILSCGSPRDHSLDAKESSDLADEIGGTELSNTDDNEMSDMSGGIRPVVISDSVDRFLIGTFSLSAVGYPPSCTLSTGNDYSLPGSVRLYSINQKIEFETSFGQGLWIADIYSDDTFDFIIQFLNTFGTPSNSLECTCEFQGPFSDGLERIYCLCEPRKSDDHYCSLVYDSV